MRQKKLGLALGSGSMRGLAHIGALEVLEREGIAFDLVAGTSMGSVAGALYVCGISPAEMERFVLSLSERKLLDVVVPKQGLIAGDRAESMLRDLTGGRTFEEALLPFATVACDFETMEQIVLREGPIYKAVRASVSTPGVFVPVMRDGRKLVDGGLLGRVPSDVARQMGADFVIAIDVGYRGTRVETKTVIDHVIHAIDIMEWVITKATVSQADITIMPDTSLINPTRLGGQVRDCIEAGRKAAQDALPDIFRLLETLDG